MGIYYSAVVAVGLQRQNIEDFDKFEELIDEGTLEVISPSYDGSDDDDAVIGFVYDESNAFSSVMFTWDQQRVDELKENFKEITGLEAKVWLTPNGQ